MWLSQLVVGHLLSRLVPCTLLFDDYTRFLHHFQTHFFHCQARSLLDRDGFEQRNATNLGVLRPPTPPPRKNPSPGVSMALHVHVQDVGLIILLHQRRSTPLLFRLQGQIPWSLTMSLMMNSTTSLMTRLKHAWLRSLSYYLQQHLPERIRLLQCRWVWSCPLAGFDAGFAFGAMVEAMDEVVQCVVSLSYVFELLYAVLTPQTSYLLLVGARPTSVVVLANGPFGRCWHLQQFVYCLLSHQLQLVLRVHRLQKIGQYFCSVCLNQPSCHQTYPYVCSAVRLVQ